MNASKKISYQVFSSKICGRHYSPCKLAELKDQDTFTWKKEPHLPQWIEKKKREGYAGSGARSKRETKRNRKQSERGTARKENFFLGKFSEGQTLWRSLSFLSSLQPRCSPDIKYNSKNAHNPNSACHNDKVMRCQISASDCFEQIRKLHSSIVKILFSCRPSVSWVGNSQENLP